MINPARKPAFENQFEHFRLRGCLLSYTRAHACHSKNPIQVLAEAWLDVPAYGRQGNFIEVRYLDGILNGQRMSRWRHQNQGLPIQSLRDQRLFPNWQKTSPAWSVPRTSPSACSDVCALTKRTSAAG